MVYGPRGQSGRRVHQPVVEVPGTEAAAVYNQSMVEVNVKVVPLIYSCVGWKYALQLMEDGQPGRHGQPAV